MILSLSFVNLRVSRFHVSNLTHETFKLCLQNTLNISKTAKVYFGVLHRLVHPAKWDISSMPYTIMTDADWCIPPSGTLDNFGLPS